MTITAADKMQCAERELKYRRRVYGRLVERGKMTTAQAERELEVMEAIALDYRALAMEEPTPLFIETKRTLKQGG
ncbi:hypothetical protein [Bradyrhizobium septentrionale]|uniref:Uncharacterized protein n=1 Tax=Bradyrhizobium septentrionale TaxID=1404411 RepID=A0ABZ2PAQ1_9BRAD